MKKQLTRFRGISVFCTLIIFMSQLTVVNSEINPKAVNPVLDFKEVTDNTLKRHWPKGVTRVILELIKPAMKGVQEVTFTFLNQI
jgi:hypothetical protein